MKVAYDAEVKVEVPKKGSGYYPKNPATLELIKFMESDHEKACLEFNETRESTQAYNTVSVYIKRHKLNVIILRRKNRLFFIKTAA